jgi:hypothetical protein
MQADPEEYDEERCSPLPSRIAERTFNLESKLLLAEELNKLMIIIMNEPNDLIARAQLGIALQAKCEPMMAKQQYESVLMMTEGDDYDSEADELNALEARAIALFHLASILNEEGDHESAMDLWDTSYLSFENIHGPDHRYTKSALHNLEGACREEVVEEHEEFNEIQAERHALQEQLAALKRSLEQPLEPNDDG